MVKIDYRKLRAEDAGRYRAVRLECLKSFPDNFGWSHEEEAATPKLAFEAALEEGSADRFMLGAFREAELVGIAGIVRGARLKTRHLCEIVQVYVDPRHRGHEVGETLLRKVVEEAFKLDGVEQLELNAIATNARAIALYTRLGFETCGVLKNHFKRGLRYWDQHLMQLPRAAYR